jgi:Lar family restriction alleviation protein
MTTEKHTAELLPCPFCGSSARIARLLSPEGERRGERPIFDVQCTECWVWHRCETEAEAVAAWNRRALLPSAALVSELVGALEELREACRERDSAPSLSAADRYTEALFDARDALLKAEAQASDLGGKEQSQGRGTAGDELPRCQPESADHDR